MFRFVSRMALVALCASAWCVSAAPSRVLFPSTLHLTRQVQDPISGKTVTIDEYCAGNRVVSVSGDKTVIADYEKQEVTEIDRRNGTYSVSRFDEMATIAESTTETKRGAGSEAPKRDRWKATPRGVRGAAGRSVEAFEFSEEGEARRKVEVDIDRSIALSQEAVEVLIGAAYPNPRREEHEPLLRAAGVRDPSRITTNSDLPKDTPYGLPVTQAFTYSDTGTEITFRTTITRIGAEGAPAELLIIPPSATRVESAAAAVRRQLRELDQPLTSSRPQQ